MPGVGKRPSGLSDVRKIVQYVKIVLCVRR